MIIIFRDALIGHSNTYLKAQCHIEVLADVALRPDFHLVVVSDVLERGILNRRPPQESIVPHEGCHLTVGASHRDTPIDPAREVGDAVLEVMMSDLHDVYEF